MIMLLLLISYILNMQCTSFTHKMRDGWGLATDGKVLFGSDGTSMLYKLDSKSLEGYYSFCLIFY
jgi:glutamine cyclotransferase